MGRVRACAWCTLFLCLVSVFALAKPKDRGKSIAEVESQASSLYQQGKYAEALAAFQHGADLGSARSQALLSYMYA